MDIIAGIVTMVMVVLMLLFCLGGTQVQAAEMLVTLLVITLVALSGFFVIAAILALSGKRVQGRFVRLSGNDEGEKNKDDSIPHNEQQKKAQGLSCAYYIVDEEEYRNLFPAEVVMKGRLYDPYRTVKLRVYKKAGFVIDSNALATIIAGVLLCVPSAVIAVAFLLMYFGAV